MTWDLMSRTGSSLARLGIKGLANAL
jgi:hypothetical protein